MYRYYLYYFYVPLEPPAICLAPIRTKTLLDGCIFLTPVRDEIDENARNED